MEQLVVNKLQEQILTRGLFSVPRLSYVLYRLVEWDNGLDIKDYLENLLIDDIDLIKFGEAFLHKTTSQGLGDYVAKVQWNINIE